MHRDSMRRSPLSAVRPAGNAQTGERARIIRSEELFAGTELVVVEHRNESYRLRQTRLGKLILTK